MKLILTVVTAVALAVGTCFANDKAETDKGILKAVDLARQKITVEVAGKEVTRTLTPTTRGVEEIDKLVGKTVTVVSSGGRVESVAPN